MADKMMRVAGRSEEGLAKAIKVDRLGNIGVHYTETDFRENPFNTKIGQDVVSLSENFWARLAREGRNRGITNENIASASGSIISHAGISPSIGTRLYPKSVIASCDKNAILYVDLKSGLADDVDFSHVSYMAAGNPLVVSFDGEFSCYEEGYIRVRVKALEDSANSFSSIFGIEVME